MVHVILHVLARERNTLILDDLRKIGVHQLSDQVEPLVSASNLNLISSGCFGCTHSIRTLIVIVIVVVVVLIISILRIDVLILILRMIVIRIETDFRDVDLDSTFQFACNLFLIL